MCNVILWFYVSTSGTVTVICCHLNFSLLELQKQSKKSLHKAINKYKFQEIHCL